VPQASKRRGHNSYTEDALDILSEQFRANSKLLERRFESVSLASETGVCAMVALLSLFRHLEKTTNALIQLKGNIARG
jgi:hypothetical protein